MKLAIVGGHLPPALAVIQDLPKNVELVYIGRKHALEGDNAVSLEYQTIASLKIPFATIRPGRLQRALTKHTLPSLARMPKGMMEAFKILRKYKPDIILAFGSYVAIPVCFAGYLLKIPIVIHEQTMEAGAANKLLVFFAKKICISWESSRSYFPAEKVILTGNPIQHASLKSKDEFNKTKNPPLIVITGGSQGSHALNLFIENIVSRLLSKYQVIHQTGDAQEFQDYNRLMNLRAGLAETMQKRYNIVKFISPFSIEKAYEKADLVISRAGMGSLMTLLFLNKPALLIPLPHGQRNEQLKNAKYFKSVGLGDYIAQKDINPEGLFNKIYDMIEQRGQYSFKDRQEFIELNANASQRIIETVFYVQEAAQKKI